ncbi:hypothetical protein [Sorangium sp. So ce1182]|uniref:hypothetical protein n=1 Tax=Sorangium sp. So ce1182 TaxID=3133334 RepID=UPI003F60DA04
MTHVHIVPVVPEIHRSSELVDLVLWWSQILGDCEVYRKRNMTGLVLEGQTLHVMDGARRVAMVEARTVDTSGPFTVTSRVRYTSSTTTSGRRRWRSTGRGS